MLRRILPSRKQPISTPVVNKNDYVNNDLTGSLSSIQIPENLTSNPKTRIRPTINISVVNKNDYVNNDLTGSLLNMQAPVQLTSNSTIRKKSQTPVVFNLKPIQNEFRDNIFKYGGRYIHKGISTWSSGSNQITIYNTIIDYGTEAVGPDNFEILYNGIHIPGIYTVEQVGNNVVISFQRRYIDYDKLEIGTSEINVYGKFKETGVIFDESMAWDDLVLMEWDDLDDMEWNL